MKPTTGLNASARNTPAACDQSTPETPEPGPAINWLARPTPRIEPIIVCDELAGRPSHQVPRFQMIAAMSSANATAPDEVSTPRKLNIPDQTTATCAGRLLV